MEKSEIIRLLRELADTLEGDKVRLDVHNTRINLHGELREIPSLSTERYQRLAPPGVFSVGISLQYENKDDILELRESR